MTLTPTQRPTSMTNELHPGEVLTAETVGLLEAGDLLRRIDGRFSIHRIEHEGGLSGRYLDGTTHANSPPSHFEWIGRPNAEGWIDAPEGGWKTDPGLNGEVRLRDGHIGPVHSSLRWNHEGNGTDIVALRLSASDEGRGSAHPQEAASVPGEGGGNPLDGAFITTRSVGNPEAAKREASLRFTFYGENSLTRVHAVRDYLEALVASDRLTHPAREDGPAGQWQDIATAPKDGTPILAFNPMVGVYNTGWTRSWAGHDAGDDYEGFPCGFWEGLGSWDCAPTHWMHLPAAPTKESA